MPHLHFRHLCPWLAAIAMFTFEPSAKPQANPGEVGSSVQRQIMDLERQGWEAAKRKDTATARRLRTDDALDVGDYGIWDKEKSVESIASSEKHPNVDLIAYSISDWRFRKASDDVIVGAYKAKLTSMSNGKRIPVVEYFSAVWVRGGNTWRNLLYHDTKEAPKTMRK